MEKRELKLRLLVDEAEAIYVAKKMLACCSLKVTDEEIKKYLFEGEDIEFDVTQMEEDALSMTGAFAAFIIESKLGID